MLLSHHIVNYLQIFLFEAAERWSVSGARRRDAIRSWREREVLVVHLQHRKGLMADNVLFFKHKRGRCYCLKDVMMQSNDYQNEEGVEELLVSMAGVVLCCGMLCFFFKFLAPWCLKVESTILHYFRIVTDILYLQNHVKIGFCQYYKDKLQYKH